MVHGENGVNILPDSRLVTPKSGINRGAHGTWASVFCANCGADGGHCPEENMTFLFYLCNKCAETYGEIAGTMYMPDEVFFQRLAIEQLELYGHYLTPSEWAVVSETPSHPLWKLIKERA